MTLHCPSCGESNTLRHPAGAPPWCEDCNEVAVQECELRCQHPDLFLDHPDMDDIEFTLEGIASLY